MSELLNFLGTCDQYTLPCYAGQLVQQEDAIFLLSHSGAATVELSSLPLNWTLGWSEGHEEEEAASTAAFPRVLIFYFPSATTELSKPDSQ